MICTGSRRKRWSSCSSRQDGWRSHAPKLEPKLACTQTGLHPNWPAPKLACTQTGLHPNWPAPKLACTQTGLHPNWPAPKLACTQIGLHQTGRMTCQQRLVVCDVRPVDEECVVMRKASFKSRGASGFLVAPPLLYCRASIPLSNQGHMESLAKLIDSQTPDLAVAERRFSDEVSQIPQRAVYPTDYPSGVSFGLA